MLDYPGGAQPVGELKQRDPDTDPMLSSSKRGKVVRQLYNVYYDICIIGQLMGN
jgi:hypothetical protein